MERELNLQVPLFPEGAFPPEPAFDDAVSPDAIAKIVESKTKHAIIVKTHTPTVPLTLCVYAKRTEVTGDGESGLRHDVARDVPATFLLGSEKYVWSHEPRAERLHELIAILSTNETIVALEIQDTGSALLRFKPGGEASLNSFETLSFRALNLFAPEAVEIRNRVALTALEVKHRAEIAELRRELAVEVYTGLHGQFHVTAQEWKSIPTMSQSLNHASERIVRATLQGYWGTDGATSAAVLVDGKPVDATGQYTSALAFGGSAHKRDDRDGGGRSGITQVTLVAVFKLAPGPHTIGVGMISHDAGKSGTLGAAHLVLEVLPAASVAAALPALAP